MGDLGAASDDGQVVDTGAVIEAFRLQAPHEVSEGSPKSLIHLIFLQIKMNQTDDCVCTEARNGFSTITPRMRLRFAEAS